MVLLEVDLRDIFSNLIHAILNIEFILLLTFGFILKIYSFSSMDIFSAPVIASIITFIGTIVVAIISIHNNRKTSRDNLRLVERTDLIEKRNSLEKKLTEFYIPFRHYLEQSKTMFKIFLKDKPDGFRTLTYLLDREKEYGEKKEKVILSDNDNALLKTIIDVGRKIEDLINEKGYLIGDDVEFVDIYKPGEGYQHIEYDNDLTLISLLVSHLITIRMAFQKEISGQVQKFEGFVFPNEINPKVNTKIQELENKVRLYDSQILGLIR
ncbi:MAG: hypothetical protein V4604_02490 [Bacteroidota bacterium]